MLSVGRTPSRVAHPNLRGLILSTQFDITAVEEQLVGYERRVRASVISLAGLNEPAYARATEELTLLWSRTLLRPNLSFSFAYCSPAGAGDGCGTGERAIGGALSAHREPISPGRR